MITDLIKGKSSEEKANIKGREIARVFPVGKFNNNGFDVEVVSVVPIDGGIEIFARAWKSGKKIGFGPDGSVDIERFRFINPPIMVPDGTTHVEMMDDMEVVVTHYKEDAVQALKDDLAHTVSVSWREGDIVKGKIGHTTDTFHPDANPETTTVDGHAVRSTANETFANKRGGVGTAADSSGALVTMGRYLNGTTSNTLSDLRRAFTLFNTGPTIPSGDSISSATWSHVIQAGNVVDTAGLSLSLVAATLASNTNIVAADYQGTVGNTTRFAADVTYASLTADGSTYNDMALNAAGIAAIAKGSGVTSIGIKVANDVDNSPASWSSGTQSFANSESAEATGGTATSPKLVVVHSSAVSVSVIPTLLTLGVG